MYEKKRGIDHIRNWSVSPLVSLAAVITSRFLVREILAYATQENIDHNIQLLSRDCGRYELFFGFEMISLEARQQNIQ